MQRGDLSTHNVCEDIGYFSTSYDSGVWLATSITGRGMTGGLVATLDGPTTSTNILQTRQTLSTNYTEQTRPTYFASEHTMHRWTHTYIASRKITQQSVSTATTVMRPLNCPVPLPTVWQQQNKTTARPANNTEHAIWIHYKTATNCHRQHVSHEQTWQDCPKSPSHHPLHILSFTSSPSHHILRIIIVV